MDPEVIYNSASDLFEKSVLPCRLGEIVEEDFPDKLRGPWHLVVQKVKYDNSYHLADCIIFTELDYCGRRRVSGILICDGFRYSILNINRRTKYWEAEEILIKNGFLCVGIAGYHLLFCREHIWVDILTSEEGGVEKSCLYYREHETARAN